MTDAPLCPHDLIMAGSCVACALDVLAAAARVPALEAEIERLRTDLGIAQSTKAEVKRGAAALLAENGELRARLAAAPDLTELREAHERYGNLEASDDDVVAAVDRLLDSVPPTSTDGGVA